MYRLKAEGKSKMQACLAPLFALLILTACTTKEAAQDLITVSPESAVVKMNTTAQFSVSPVGTNVLWSIKGDSEEQLGVIDSSGSYKAPSDPATAPEKLVISATDSSGTSGSASVFLTTFNSNKRLTMNYAKGQYTPDTYSSGQKGIAVFKDKDTDENTNIYTVWADNSLGDSQIWFSRSSDNGAKFSQPETVAELLSAKQVSPSISADSNGNAYIVWEDYREGDADILFRKFDGSSFSLIKEINTDILDYDSSPSIAVNDFGVVFIVWEHRDDSNDDYPDIYFSKSTDNGENFSTQYRISVNGRRPSIAIDDSGVAYVVWEELAGFLLGPATHIMMSKIVDTTASEPVQVDSLTSDTSHARYPSVAVTPDGKKVYVVWQRAEIKSPAFEKEVTLSYDIDLAVKDIQSDIITQLPSIPDSNNAGYVGGYAYPSIASDNKNVYIVWDDQRNGNFTKDIYFTKSSDGVNFKTNRIVNDDDTGLWHEKPSVAVFDGKGYVIWTDFRNTSGDVFFAKE